MSLSCCESSSIQHLSLADCSSCWLSLVDSTAREQSDDPSVVMVVIVVMALLAACELFQLGALDAALLAMGLCCPLQEACPGMMGPVKAELQGLPCYRLGCP